ncbi:MAG: hypothetical protein J6K85_01275 [Clostridia bacterium]|nr:hypothetical protein [Clostridia bacterium]
MKNEEKLLLAIGEISDDIISEVSEPYKRKPFPMKQTLAIAASLAVVVVGVSLSGIFDARLDKNMSGAASAPELNDGHYDGSNGSGKFDDVAYLGAIAYVGKVGENSFSFNLSLNMDSPIHVTLKSLDGTVIYTTENISDEDVEIRRPTITVNGEAADALPSLAGEYDITITFDGMEENIEWSEYISINPFGDYRCFN